MTWLLKGHAPDWEFDRLDEEYRGPVFGPGLHDVKAGQFVLEYDVDHQVCRTVFLIVEHHLVRIDWPEHPTRRFTGFGILMRRVTEPLPPHEGIPLPTAENLRITHPMHDLHTFLPISHDLLVDVCEELVRMSEPAPADSVVSTTARLSLAQMLKRLFGMNGHGSS